MDSIQSNSARSVSYISWSFYGKTVVKGIVCGFNSFLAHPFMSYYVDNLDSLPEAFCTIPSDYVSDSRLFAEQVRVPFPLSLLSFQNLQHLDRRFKPHLLSASISFHSCHPNTGSIPRRQIKVSKNGMYGGLIFSMYCS